MDFFEFVPGPTLPLIALHNATSIANEGWLADM